MDRAGKGHRKTAPKSRRFDVAVFPLLDAVLFPGVTLPLRILEERYNQLLRDVLARDWLVAVSLVVPDGTDGEGRFAFNNVCGAGRLQLFREYKDGRSEILIHGRSRIRLLSMIQRDPYIVIEAEHIPLEESLLSPSRTFMDFQQLVKSWAFLNPKLPETVIRLFDEFDSYGELCDFFAFHFIAEPREKQLFLNCTDPIERTEMLGSRLRKDLIRLERKTVGENRSRLIH